MALLALRLGGSGIHFGRGRLSATYHHSSDALNVVMVMMMVMMTMMVVVMMMKGHLTIGICMILIMRFANIVTQSVFMRGAEHSSSTHLGVDCPTR